MFCFTTTQDEVGEDFILSYRKHVLKHNGIQNQKNGQMSIYSNMASSVLLLATVIAKVLVKSAVLVILSFPLYLLPVKANLTYIFLSTIFCISVSQTTFHISVTSVADAS